MIRYMLILLLAAAAPLAAQNASAEGGRDTANSAGVPADHRPPPGMCRIWINDVPAARQPAPTDCSTAIRRRPPNARVVFGKELQATDEKRVRIPGVMPLVEQRRKPADAQRAPAQRDGDAPRPADQPRPRDSSPTPVPTPQRPTPEQLRPKDGQAQPRPAERQPQTRERRPEVRRPEPRRATPRRIDPPRARSSQPARTQRPPSQGQRRRPSF